jgi:hypothetical protein
MQVLLLQAAPYSIFRLATAQIAAPLSSIGSPRWSFSPRPPHRGIHHPRDREMINDARSDQKESICTPGMIAR